MTYKPTPDDAMSAYIAAAAYEYVEPIEAISDTRHLLAAIEPLRDGTMQFRIINHKDVFNEGLFTGLLMPSVATCKYDGDGDLWEVDSYEVHVHGGKPFLVQNSEGSFAVVEAHL